MRNFALLSTLLFSSISVFGQENKTDYTNQTSQISNQNNVEGLDLVFDYKYCFDKEECLKTMNNQISEYIFKKMDDSILNAIPETKLDSIITKNLRFTYWVNKDGSIETSLFASNIKNNKYLNEELKKLLSKVNYEIDKDNYLTESDLDNQFFNSIALKKDSINKHFKIYYPKENIERNYSKDSIFPPTFRNCKIKKKKKLQLNDKFDLEKKCMEEKISKIVAKNYNINVMNTAFRFLKSNFNISDKKISVIVNFKFNKKGEITNIEPLSILSELESEAFRVISLIPNVIPGLKKDKPIGVLYSLPITFKID